MFFYLYFYLLFIYINDPKENLSLNVSKQKLVGLTSIVCPD